LPNSPKYSIDIFDVLAMGSDSEKVSPSFDQSALQQARTLTWDCVRAIAQRVHPGMFEEEARAIASEVLQAHGAQRSWHKALVRFGVNTTCPFSEPSLPGVRLQERDLFFVDIGPVFNGYEGDAGASFAVGDLSEMQRCVSDSEAIFQLIRNRWRETGATGEALYTYAQSLAEERGWLFLLAGASGHRIADFPHAAYHRGPLKAFDLTPSPARWVLEVHLRHPEFSFGAFYEDVLD
jgi:methionyl aminopeptidase